MAQLTDAEIAYLTPVVNTQAARVAARYEGVETDDLAQEIWLWIVEESSPALHEYIAADHAGRTAKSVYNAGVKWCEADRKRKLRALGIDWRDDYNYSRPEVARLLPLALDSSTVPGLSGTGLHDGPSAKTDPAYGGGLLASLIDVRTAYSKLSPDDRDFVLIVVGLDTKWEDVAATTGLKAQSAYAKWMRILDRMVTRHLGRKTDDGDE